MTDKISFHSCSREGQMNAIAQELQHIVEEVAQPLDPREHISQRTMCCNSWAIAFIYLPHPIRIFIATRLRRSTKRWADKAVAYLRFADVLERGL